MNKLNFIFLLLSISLIASTFSLENLSVHNTDKYKKTLKTKLKPEEPKQEQSQPEKSKKESPKEKYHKEKSPKEKSPKETHNKPTKQTSICKGVKRDLSSCYNFKNCFNYQVTPKLNDYGCSLCNEGYEIVEDINGSGYCANNPNSVENCQFKAKSILYGNGDSICYFCKQGFVLSSDKKSCHHFGINPHCREIVNCEHYGETEEKKVQCIGCRSGFTLSEDGQSCINGCKIENCQTCAMHKGKQYCNICNTGTIGIFETNLDLYDACLTCKSWQCLLLTSKGKECCLKDKI